MVVADNNVGCSCRNGIAGTNNCDMSDLVSGVEGEENFVGDSEIIALGGASNETKDRPLG